MPNAPASTALARLVSRATHRARRAPKLRVERVEERTSWPRPLPFRLFGKLGSQRVELTRFGGRVELYTIDDDGLACFRGYAPPVLATQARAVLG